jgi:prepilin peptidase dependent protein B
MKKQSGYTLLEIMITLFLGLIVVGSTINIYITTVGSSSSIIKSARLNHDLEAIITLMINDIKRSGYWAGATVATDTRTNPFTASSTNIQMFDTDADDDTDADCILYTYDANGDGTVNSNGNEYYGFKLEKYTENGNEYKRIKIRKSGTTTAVAGCGTTDQVWETFIDDSQLTITTVQFSFVPITNPALPATSRCLNVTKNTVTNAAACSGADPGDNLGDKRIVNIHLTAQLKNEASVTKTLNNTVEVRNNRLYQQS